MDDLEALGEVLNSSPQLPSDKQPPSFTERSRVAGRRDPPGPQLRLIPPERIVSWPLGGASILRLLRLARLTRMARLARAVPELMILVKAMISSTRSVSLTMVLLTAALYIFAVIFAQMLPGTDGF